MFAALGRLVSRRPWFVVLPSLTALIGHAAWWPGHGDETAAGHAARVAGNEPAVAGAEQH